MVDILEMIANYVGAKIKIAFGQRVLCTKTSTKLRGRTEISSGYHPLCSYTFVDIL